MRKYPKRFLVSNPLRLEGDATATRYRKLFKEVSNPLRLEGDARSSRRGARGRFVSNPLRLEGDYRVILREVAGVDCF